MLDLSRDVVITRLLARPMEWRAFVSLFCCEWGAHVPSRLILRTRLYCQLLVLHLLPGRVSA